jgi:CheY-like chemotaxis protein
VPLVVLASTTEREQVELHDLVQSLSAEGYQTAHRGRQWIVYTKITDRRKPGIGRFRKTAREQRRSVNRFESSRCDSDRAEPASSGVYPPSIVMDGPRTVNAGKHPRSQAATILIVDDDPTTADTFGQVLRLAGYEVRTALSAESGMRAVHESGPDAILVDYNLPVANGVEFLRRLRACEEHRDTPVAIVTGDYSVDDSVGTELHQLGARVAFKPLSSAELVDLTSRLLAGRHSIHDVDTPSEFDEDHRIHL